MLRHTQQAPELSALSIVIVSSAFRHFIKQFGQLGDPLGDACETWIELFKMLHAQTELLYEPGSTDFGADIRELRKMDAEALFMTSDTEDLVLILPQFSFYEYGVQLLGTSAWNSSNLLRMTGRDMEGALFPAEQDPGMNEGRYLAAASLLGEDETDVNRFVTGGYSAVRKLIEAMRSAKESETTVREALEKMMSERRHRYIETVSAEGIEILTVRGERVKEYTRIGPMIR